MDVSLTRQRTAHDSLLHHVVDKAIGWLLTRSKLVFTTAHVELLKQRQAVFYVAQHGAEVRTPTRSSVGQEGFDLTRRAGGGMLTLCPQAAALPALPSMHDSP